VPGSSVAGSPEFNRVAQLQISPVFVARRISDVKTEYRSTRQGHDRSTHRFGLVLPFCVTAVFDPKPSKAAILHPANQCGNRVTEPDRTNWRPTSQTSPVWIFAKRSPELCRHCSFRARGVRRPTGHMGAQTFFLIWTQPTSVSADPASGEGLRVGVFRFV